VVGISKNAEAKLRFLPDGTVQMMARARMESFDSRNGNRDAHMLEVVEAARYPWVEFKAASDRLAPPLKASSKFQKLKLQGVLNFHGVEKPQEVEVTFTFTGRDQLNAKASFSLSLEAFNIERPSLMFVKVDDKLVIESKLNLVKEKAP
jgi:polyisoprenoid-binding protein YceI